MQVGFKSLETIFLAVSPNQTLRFFYHICETQQFLIIIFFFSDGKIAGVDERIYADVKMWSSAMSLVVQVTGPGGGGSAPPPGQKGVVISTVGSRLPPPAHVHQPPFSFQAELSSELKDLLKIYYAG